MAAYAIEAGMAPIGCGWLLRSGAGLLALAALAGCSTIGEFGRATGSEPRADLVTASDETDARRRARIRLELASGYFEQGQTTVALDEVKQALNADPNFADAYNLRGLVYMRLGDPELAEGSFRRAVQLNPRDASTAHNYGWLLCQQGRHAESLQWFDRALTLPNYTSRDKTLMARGLCQMRSGDVAGAEQSLLQAYELDPSNPVVAYNLATLLHVRGQSQDAQFYIRRLNNSALANAESLWLGIRVERRLGNREAVVQLAEPLRRRFPQSREFAAYEKGAFDE